MPVVGARRSTHPARRADAARTSLVDKRAIVACAATGVSEDLERRVDVDALRIAVQGGLVAVIGARAVRSRNRGECRFGGTDRCRSISIFDLFKNARRG